MLYLIWIKAYKDNCKLKSLNKFKIILQFIFTDK